MSPLDGFSPWWRAPWDAAGLPYPYEERERDGVGGLRILHDGVSDDGVSEDGRKSGGGSPADMPAVLEADQPGQPALSDRGATR